MRNRLFIAGLTVVVLSCTTKPHSPPGFQVERGFGLELVASEPLIKDPVDLEFNERGEALVLEMPGYPFEDQQSRILLLRDSDQDGVYDETQVYAEKLQLASSILPWRDGVLVAAPPYLLHVRDLNNDRTADQVDTLMGGFSTGNLQHNYNGLVYGLDNWIYAANGGNSGKPYWWGDAAHALDLKGQDFRFHQDTRMLERVGESSGGFGVAMDEAGHQFGTHNLNHVSQLVFPERYIGDTRTLPENTLENISDHEENGLARIYPIGEQETRVNHPEQSGYFSGSCGITYYGGGAYGAEYDHTIWVADVVLNLVHVDKVRTSGASLRAGRVMDKREFLASTDRSFRPVNLTVGPEGALYVVDMYRKVIEHPEWIPDEIEKTLDLNAGKDKGRIYRITKDKSKFERFDVSQWQTPEGMIASLGHPNQWVRKTAQRLLVDVPFGSSLAAGLSQALKSTSPYARLHALWTLQSRKLLTQTQLVSALRDQDASMRENALIIAAGQVTPGEVEEAVATALTDSDARIRLQAALTISTLPAQALQGSRDRWLKTLVASAKLPTDQWNVAALTLASRPIALAYFKELLPTGNLALLSSLTMTCVRQGELADLLSALAQSNRSAADQRAIIHQATLVAGGSADAQLRNAITAIEATADAALVAELTALRRQLGLPVSEKFVQQSALALQRVSDRSLADSVRLQNMTLVALIPYSNKDKLLFQCLSNAEPLALQEAALRQLAESDDRAVGKKLVAEWKSLGPQTRRLASDLLLYKKIHHDALLTGLETGVINIGEMNFDLERRRALLWWTDDENTKRRAERLFTDAGVVTRQAAMDKMKDALTLAGNAANGAKVFGTICSNCHQYGSSGKNVGPVLTEINRKSKESLLHDILDPNAAVNTEYISHRLETVGGAIHVGVVSSENNDRLTMKKMGGEEITLSKAEVKSLTSLGTSLMMEGLESSMTPQELADLLAFLQSGLQ